MCTQQEKIVLAKSLAIDVIISMYIPITYTSQNKVEAICPFHNDRTLGSFSISSQKDVFTCFSCGESGDGIDFVKKYLGVDFKTAVNDIYDRFDSKKFVDRKSVFKSGQKKGKHTSDLCPDDLDYLYRLLLSCATLSDGHKDYLLNRNLTESEITQRGFKSTNLDLKEFIHRLDKDGVDRSILMDMPGFFMEDNQWKCNLYPGIFIPIYDLNGNISALQIRKDHVEKGSRYVWLSSSFDTETGTSSGSPIDVNLIRTKKRLLFITEGVFKSLAIARYLKCSCLSVQGVNNIRGIEEIIQRLHKVWPLSGICVAFDADKVHNSSVLKAQNTLIKRIKEVVDIPIQVINWDPGLGKGIDDYLIAKYEA